MGRRALHVDEAGRGLDLRLDAALRRHPDPLDQLRAVDLRDDDAVGARLHDGGDVVRVPAGGDAVDPNGDRRTEPARDDGAQTFSRAIS
jgi:hypothetical protein